MPTWTEEEYAAFLQRQKRGKKPPAPPPGPTEAQVQAACVEGLTALRYRILQIGQGRHQVSCPHCRGVFVPPGWQGNDPGAPDLIVMHDGYPVGLGVLLELKTAEGGWNCDEQRVLHEAGRIRLARGWEDVRREIAEAEQFLKG